MSPFRNKIKCESIIAFKTVLENYLIGTTFVALDTNTLLFYLTGAEFCNTFFNVILGREKDT
jgi:hypothetical protein